MYLHCHLTENIKDKDKPVLLIYVISFVESEYTFNYNKKTNFLSCYCFDMDVRYDIGPFITENAVISVYVGDSRGLQWLLLVLKP